MKSTLLIGMIALIASVGPTLAQGKDVEATEARNIRLLTAMGRELIRTTRLPAPNRYIARRGKGAAASLRGFARARRRLHALLCNAIDNGRTPTGSDTRRLAGLIERLGAMAVRIELYEACSEEEGQFASCLALAKRYLDLAGLIARGDRSS